MASSDTVGIGVAGLGGYGGVISDAILSQGTGLRRPAKLLAVCDPEPNQHAERVAELRRQGVEIFTSYEQMLAAPGLEAVWLPLPIHLHRPFAEQALAAGKAVAIEKPAAGTVDDVDAMIAARDRAGLPLIVGFQDIYDATTLPLKRRIMAGEFGRITGATLHACWPRTNEYFGRNNWAGRQRVGDTWILDSPANNALAHPINLTQFLLGPSIEASATPLAVEAELYRAADIENYDTVSARVTLEGDVKFLILLTHATATTRHPVVVLQSERGRIIREMDRTTVEMDGKKEVMEPEVPRRQTMLECFTHLVRGERAPISTAGGDIAAATLEVARNHTLLINGISEAAAVVTAPPDAVRTVPIRDAQVEAIVGIEDVFEKCAQRNQMLHESSLLPFTRPAGGVTLQGYTHFSGPRRTTDEPAATPT